MGERITNCGMVPIACLRRLKLRSDPGGRGGALGPILARLPLLNSPPRLFLTFEL